MKFWNIQAAISSLFASRRTFLNSSRSGTVIPDDPDAVKERIAIDEATKILRLQNGGLSHEKPFSSPTLEDEHVTISGKKCPFRFVPLRIDGGSHESSRFSADLLDEIGGLNGLEAMTERFYDKAFEDATLDKFIRSHNDPHGHRFATWIHQKLGGPGELWSKERAMRPKEAVRVVGGRVVVHDRSSAHVAAWYSPKRPAREVGRHFKLDECRVWMRLHFWAMREAGLLELSPSFCDYYVRFIAHFVRVYESKAPAFARDSFRWSEDSKNIEAYIANGRKMSDVLGLPYEKQLAQIPRSEAEDVEWPYIEK